MLPGKLFHKAHDLPASGRVESACWFVQEKYLRAGHELRGNTDSALLPTRDTLADRSADDCICLTMQSKGREQTFNTGFAFYLANGAANSQI